MTRPTRSISILADVRRRRATLAIALTTLALLGAVAAAGTATAQSDRPAVVVTDGTTAPDGTTTVGVVLTNAPDGLSGYYLDLTVENTDVARIDATGYPDQFGLTSEPVIGNDGATVTLEAADMEGAIEPGATDVTLATVTVAGAAPGSVELTVEPRQFDADDGSAFSPATGSGTVTVSDGGDGDSDTAGGATRTGDAADGDAPASDGGGDTEGSSNGDENDAEATAGDGSLPTVLSLVAIGLLAVAGLRRRT
jgi:hypothetical protein